MRDFWIGVLTLLAFEAAVGSLWWLFGPCCSLKYWGELWNNRQ